MVWTVAMIVTGCATVSAINDMEKQIETDQDHMKGNAQFVNIWLWNPKLILFLSVCTMGTVRFVYSLEITQIFWCIFHDLPVIFLQTTLETYLINTYPNSFCLDCFMTLIFSL